MAKDNARQIKLAAEQESAIKLMLSGKNVFLTGEAGTGKSTIMREFRRRCEKECVFLAPTGIAAVNIEGQTIHSFFLLPPGLLGSEPLEELGSSRRKSLISKARVIVIDEISMVRSDLLWGIDERLRSVARGKASGKPFGGRQVIVVGDFFQLPPVVKTETEETFLEKTFGGSYAFQSELWRQANFQCVRLKTIHRQKNDALFMSLLNHIRSGKLDERDIEVEPSGEPLNVLESLNHLCVTTAPKAEDPICLCTTNREAQTINDLRESQLDGERKIFNAELTGRFPQKELPAPSQLTLCAGAKVMLLVNKHLPDGTMEYVNGDVGIVEEINRDATVTVKLDNGKICSIAANQWSYKEYVLERDENSGKEVIRQREVGKFTQMPLKLAYAITIHKSQGLSLDAVHIRMGNGCFAHGQFYTALSRCRSLDGLSIDRKLYHGDVILDDAVVDFYNSMDAPGPEKQTVNIAIPKEHEAAVRALLAQLAGAKPVTANPNPSTEAPRLFTEYSEPERIYRHPDINMLMMVYGNQTGGEKARGMTKQKNKIGFNKFDAPVLSEIAEKYKADGWITKPQLDTVSKLIHKYRAQCGLDK